MKKTTLNFIINALMLFCMCATIGIGFLIKYTLVSGQEQMFKYGNKVELSLFGFDRHEWGAIHLLVGYILIGLLLLHIILHWKVIISVYKKILVKKPAIKFISILFITICCLFIIIPFVANIDAIKLKHITKVEKRHLHRNLHN